MFFAEERVRQDASILLFLLVFNDFCVGTPSNATLSLPQLVQDRLNVPFRCRAYWDKSEYTEDSQIGEWRIFGVYC